MIRHVLTTALFAGLALAAQAQTATVRSGEHDGFSRLVVHLPQRTDWRVTRSGQGARLVFGDAGLRLDTSRVFDRIPRARLTGIRWSQSEHSLYLSLGCDCALETFWHGQAMLVVDIRDPAEAAAGARAAEIRPVPAPPRGPGSSAPAAAPAGDPVLPLGPLPGRDRPPGGGAGPALPGLRAAGPWTPPRDLQTMRGRLLRELDRAAVQGLLSPGATWTAPEAARKTRRGAAQTDTPDAAARRTAGGAPGANGIHINLVAESSIDREIHNTIAGALPETGEAGCLDARMIDVPSWGRPARFAEQVGALRRRLTGEFDETDPEAAIALARLYIYFGFGAEARQALQLVPAGTGDTAILSSLAQIADSGHASAGSPLAGTLDCDSPVALWSALSYPALPADAPVNGDAVLRGFNALPAHLRARYGPVLTRRFLDTGRPDITEKLLKILERNRRTVTPGAELVRAQAELARGAGAPDVRQTLEAVVNTGSAPSAEALVTLIETHLKAGEPVSLDTATLAGAYARQYRSEPLGRALAKAHVMALAAAGAFGRAQDELRRVAPELEPAERAALRGRFLMHLARDAEAPTFLRHALTAAREAPETLPAEAGNATARRLLEAGFPQPAGVFVASDAGTAGNAARDRQLLRARISLALQRPRQAEVDLLGISSAEANLLRARARSAIGEHDAAYHLLAAQDRPAAAGRQAWLAEDWTHAARSGPPVLADLAALLGAGTARRPGDAEPGVLARNRALLSESATARDVLGRLLAAHPMPAALPEPDRSY